MSTDDDAATAATGDPPDAQLAAFHDELIALRASAGAPSYARLARRIGQPRPTVYDAFRRPSLPSLELLTALVRLLGGDVDEWRARWAQLRARSDSGAATDDSPAGTDDAASSRNAGTGRTGEAATAPAARGPHAPESGVRTRSDGLDRRSNGRWWAVLVAVAVVVAAVTVVITRLVTDDSRGCTTYRVYRVTSSGSLLDADSVEQGRTSRDDLVLVSSTSDHTFHARYPSIDLTTGKRGYVDQSRINFVRESGCL